MAKSKSKPSTPAKSATAVKPVKDLELDKSQSGSVRGGTTGFNGAPGVLSSGALLPGKVSDATVKTQVLQLEDALMRLRGLRI